VPANKDIPRAIRLTVIAAIAVEGFKMKAKGALPDQCSMFCWQMACLLLGYDPESVADIKLYDEDLSIVVSQLGSADLIEDDPNAKKNPQLN
jgi:hypothetical protein